MAARSLLLPFALLVGTACAAQAGAAPLGSAPTDVMQVLADLTLIDGTCPNDVVNFGPVLRFAADKGVPAVEMMPGGARRADFEAVLRARRASFDKDELCGEIAENYAEALPGSVDARPEGRGRP